MPTIVNDDSGRYVNTFNEAVFRETGLVQENPVCDRRVAFYIEKAQVHIGFFLFLNFYKTVSTPVGQAIFLPGGSIQVELDSRKYLEHFTNVASWIETMGATVTIKVPAV
jgi:hypothetical protein